jgi:hypothetical protein
VPLHAALEVLGRDAAELPDDEGPFSLHSPEVLAATLAPAGWTDVRAEVRRLRLPYGGNVEPAVAAPTSLDSGPTRVVTADADDATKARVVEAIAEAMGRHVDGQGHVVLDATVLITTANRPG